MSIPQTNDDDNAMMAMMMDESTMEIAFNKHRSWVKTKMGTMMTMTMQYDVASDSMMMLMQGIMGNMAYQGSIKELAQEEQPEKKTDIRFVKEKKKILSYKCKKAIIKDAEGNESIYWYTEELQRPAEVNQMPNEIPGLCLEMEMITQGVRIIYTAIEVDKKADMDQYTVTIPEGVAIQSFDDMKKMGAGL